MVIVSCEFVRKKEKFSCHQELSCTAVSNGVCAGSLVGPLRVCGLGTWGRQALVQSTGFCLGREEGSSRALCSFLCWFGLCQAALLLHLPWLEVLQFGASMSSMFVLVGFVCLFGFFP